jgi:hypothetical protein
MRENRRYRTPVNVLLLVAAVALTLAATPALAAEPPTGKHYGIILMVGLPDGEGGTIVAAEKECIVFRKGRACGQDFCGAWDITSEGQKQSTWTATFEDVVVDNQLATLVLDGATQWAGRRSSIGGTGTMQLQSVLLNWSFAGTEMGRKACFAFDAEDDG